MKRNVNNNGITLIALVVTIIVLLILAGVSISMLTGENGILNRAGEAKEKTTLSQKKETTDLANMEEIISNGIEGKYLDKVTDNNPGILEKESENIYIINSIEDLVFFSYDVRNGNTYEGNIVKLGTDLNFNSDNSYVDAFRTDYGKYGYNGELKTLLTSGEGFLSIGTIENTKEKCFKGTFDGNNHEIKNLYINKNANDGVKRIGLFGTNIGIIKNIKLVDININAECVSASIGGITGINYGRISNCVSSGNLYLKGTGYLLCAGVAGAMRENGNIENCGNSANIICENNATDGQAVGAGVVGSCNNNASSTDLTPYIKGCYNTGKVNARSEIDVLAGGITTYITRCDVIDCYNSGEINATGNKDVRIGGIISAGDNSQHTVKNLYNTGKIVYNGTTTDEKASLGGIIGQNYNTNITNVVNLGEIDVINENTQIRIGGIAGGATFGDIDNGYNLGKIIVDQETKNEKIGSLVGIKWNSVYNKCFYLNETYSKGIGKLATSEEKEEGIAKLINKEDFPDLLEIINDDDKFKNDNNNINNGYPVLFWQ